MGAVWQFAGSLAAVAFMVGLAWRFGFAGTPELADEREARVIADGLHGGFEAVKVALDAHRHAALLLDSAGRVALVRPHGAHFLAEMLDGTARATARGAVLDLAFATSSLQLDLGPSEAGDWAAAIDRLG